MQYNSLSLSDPTGPASLQECALLYVVVVEADLSFFSFADRYAMVKLGTADLGNVKVLRSGPYTLLKSDRDSHKQ